jgi:hypothetical protein
MNTMTRRHYELVAGTINRLKAYLDDKSRRRVALEFAEALAGTNDRFDRERFMKACGVC